AMNLLKIKPDFLDRKYRGRMFLRQIIFSILFLFLALPLFLFGLIHNYLPFRFTDFLVPKISKEVEYYAPLAVLIGILLYPIWYACWAYLLSLYIHPDWPIIVYFIALPVSGIFAYFFIDYLKHIGYKWSYLFAVRNKESQVKELKLKREKLRSYFE
ncbi:MAG: hypothetical protein KJ941_00540, partial [Bacteroidetes bacterium]|nr:hypothetical protein [Bacteroidota bacterium]